MNVNNTSKILFIQDHDGIRTLRNTSKDSIRKIPVVTELPFPTESREGLTVLYDNGDGMADYVCVRTADGGYTWISATLLRYLIPWDAVEQITNYAEFDGGTFAMYGNGIFEDGGTVIIDDDNIIVEAGTLTF